MKTRALVLAGLMAAAAASAVASAPPRTAVLAPILAAQDDEPRVTDALRGVLVLPAPPAPGAARGPAEAGVDASRVPELDSELFRLALAPFLGQPASMNSLQRLQDIVRGHLQAFGHPLANVYLPPQDVTDGVVRVVVQFAALEGEVAVAGHRWFAPGAYAAAVRQRAGERLDATALREDIAWLNRNPFRRVRPVIEAGAQPATTRVTLRTEERLPLALNAGYANTGTRATGEDRVSAGVQWGNAFGRGDLLNVGAAGDPQWRHQRSFSAGYTAFLPWRQLLTLQGAHAAIASIVPEPFVQAGTSWQAGARYEVPLRAPRPGWTQTLSFTADFKYSDNTLEFAAIPVTGNVTHLAQVGATYGVGFVAFGGRNSVAFTGAASPGGLTARNRDRDFDGSRPGARADYVHGKLALSHRRSLPAGFELAMTADLQAASGALLGSEQLNGGGAGAVRGYRESSAFGDAGFVGNAELHAPGFDAAGGRIAGGFFAFADAASLNLRGDRESTDLRSAGVGANLAVFRRLSVRVAYGWQLKALDRAPGERGHGHVAANLGW
jgi:hemolysin activation/secretion protein